MKKYILLVLIVAFISCQENSKKKENLKNKNEYYTNSTDSIHLQNIENNLTPFYSIKGKTKQVTIPQMMKMESIPGLSMVFVDKGKIVWSKQYGYANLKDSIKVDANTVFTGASLSKPLTAIGALHLADKNLLELDENVNLKLTEWKVPENELTKIEKVTLRRLIGHNAGITNDLWSSYLPNEKVPSLNQMLAGEKPSVDPATSVIYKPGSKVKYSNPGYSIIQKLMMDVTQKEFAQLMDEIVLEPSGMRNSSFQQPIRENLMKNRATGYSSDLEPYVYKLFPYQAAGGIWTTPEDLGKFMITLLNDYHNGTNTLISKEMANEVFSNNIRRYVFTLWNWKEDVVFRHTGSNQGFKSFMFGSVKNNQGIVVMTNSENSFSMFDFIMRAVSQEYSWEYFRPEVYNSIEIESDEFKPYIGKYILNNQEITISLNNNQLRLSSDEITNEQLIPVAENTFLLASLPLKLIFSKEDISKIVIYLPNGDYSEAIKIN